MEKKYINQSLYTSSVQMFCANEYRCMYIRTYWPECSWRRRLPSLACGWRDIAECRGGLVASRNAVSCLQWERNRAGREAARRTSPSSPTVHEESIINGTKQVENDFRGMWYGDHVIKKKGNKGPSLLRQKFIIYIVCLHLLRFVWCSTISVN